MPKPVLSLNTRRAVPAESDVAWEESFPLGDEFTTAAAFWAVSTLEWMRFGSRAVHEGSVVHSGSRSSWPILLA